MLSNYFKNYSREEINYMLKKLSDEEKNLLYLKLNKQLTKEQEKKFYVSLLPKMKKILTRKLNKNLIFLTNLTNYLEINNKTYLKVLNTYLRSNEFKSLENLLSFKNALLLSLNLGLIDNTTFSLDELSLIFKIPRDSLENILKESLSILNTKKMKLYICK